MIARRFVVRGRVQGVGFRFFVIRAARDLGLAGWTRNQADGSVELMAQGAPDAVEALGPLLKEGPRAARVTEVLQEEISPDPDTIEFDIKF